MGRAKLTTTLLLMLVVVPQLQAGTITVTNTNDSGPGSLRQAIADAMPGVEIQFDLSLDGQAIVLTKGHLVIDKSLTISGRGSDKTILDGNQSSRVIYVPPNGPTVVRIAEVTIRNGRAGAQSGGGILNIGDLTIESSIIRGNSAAWGGGIYSQGPLRVRNSMISDNAAEGHGGGIWKTTFDLTIENSTISGNSAGSGSGGIGSEDNLILTNSTISNNSGIGIVARFGLLTLTNITVSGNSVGGIYSFGSLAMLSNSIIADHTQGRDCWLPVSSRGHNIDSDGSCGLDQPTDQPNTDPMLGPLEDNYGPTWTHRPMPGSPLIDRGNCQFLTDQRGVPRPLDGNQDSAAICDIGAVEYAPVKVIDPDGDVIVDPSDPE